MKNRVLSMLFIFVILIGFLPINAHAAPEDNLNLSLIPSPPIDIVLTVGQTNLNLTNFEKDIKKNLTDRGIDGSKINVQAIETQTTVADASSASDILGKWKNFTIAGSNSSTSNDYFISGDKLIRSNTSNTRPAQGYYDASTKAFNTGDAIYEFKWGIDSVNYGSFVHGEAGFLFRMKDENNYYAYLNDNHRACGNIRIDGGEAIVKVTNDSYQILASASFPSYYRGQEESMKIVTEGDSIKVYRNGTLRLSTTDSTYKKGSHGFYVWDQYGAYFSNIKLTTSASKEFSEVIREPQWRPSAKRFIVNADNNLVGDFDRPSALGEILPRLINEDIHYIGWGSTANQTQANTFITKNNGKGTFVLSSQAYATSINQIGQYIYNNLNLATGTGDQYVVVGTPMQINVNPASLATNTQTTEYPNGRWRILHDYTYFENNQGQASWANQWQKNLMMVFDKPGRYEIFFGDKNPTPRYVYAHRLPTANFSVSTVAGNPNYTVTLTNLSYDIDGQSRADKGLAAEEWKWRNTSSTAWTNGKPTSLPAGAEYVIQLRVKDREGAWSTPIAKYVSTNTATVAPPVADFNISPNPVTPFQTTTTQDTSYDPGGKAINLREWKVTNSAGTVIYTGSTPKNTWTGTSIGEYTISLRVQNASNLYSEWFNRKLQIVADEQKPEVIVNPASHDWTTGNISVALAFSDPGGSGFKQQRYALSTSSTKPTTGWSAWETSTSRIVNITAPSQWYLHIEAQDNAGNTLYQSMGTYSKLNALHTEINPTSFKYTLEGPPANTVTYQHNGVISNSQPISKVISGLAPNTIQKIKYKIATIGSTAWTQEYSFYTAALKPQKGEFREYIDGKAKMKFFPEKFNGAVVDQRYQFKLVPVGGGSDILSVEHREDTLVTFSGLVNGKKYEVWGLGINDENTKTAWNRMKDESGEPLFIIAENNMEIKPKGQPDWITSKTTEVTLGLGLTDIDSIKEPLRMALDGVEYELLSNPFDRAGTSTTVDVDLKVQSGASFSVRREIEGPKSILHIVLPNLKQGENTLTFRGGDGSDEVPVKLGYDTQGPAIASGAFNAVALDANKQMISVDGTKVSDVSTPFSQIKISINGAGLTGLATKHLVSLAPSTPITIVLEDRFGQQSSTTLTAGEYTTPPQETDGGPSDGNTGGTTPGTGGDSGETSTQVDTTSPNVKVPIPSGGTHFRTSLDGVTWSNWQQKNGLTEVTITLPTGDGIKTTYVQTGEASTKMVPVATVDGQINYVPSKTTEITPINNTQTQKFEMDMQAPKITVRTQENSLIAKGGSINFLVDIVDAMDRQPRVKLTLKTNGITKSGNSIETVTKEGTMRNGETTLNFPITGLTESYRNGKLTFYTLEVLSWDKSGNRSVEFVNFYVKN